MHTETIEAAATTWVDGHDFGEAVAQACQDPACDFLLLTREDDRVVAVAAIAGQGVREWIAPVPASRPSAAGLGAALGDEAACSPDTWLLPAPPPPTTRAEGVFTFPLGPVRGDTMESVGLHLRVIGDEILYLDVQVERKARGLAAVMVGRDLRGAAEVAARVTGTTTVAHAFAFARAVETALGLTVSPWDSWVRGLLAEGERIACHLGDLALLAGSTGLPIAQMELLALKERVLRAHAALTGHRYLRDMVLPGGLGRPLAPDAIVAWVEAIVATRDRARRILDELVHTSSVVDRLVRAGRVPPATVAYVEPVGPTGRAAGRDRDARRDHAYPPYDRMPLRTVPVRPEADAWARFLVRLEELSVSYAWLSDALRPALDSLAAREGDGPSFGHGRRRRSGAGGADGTDSADGAVGIGLVEGPRGPVVYRIVLSAEGTPGLPHVAHAAIASPSRRNWYVVPASVANGNTMQDVPIIDASFALSVAGAAL